MRVLAYLDPLTGIGNRRYFDATHDQQFAMFERIGRRYGVLYIDVDDFKTINDTLGHTGGDEALRFIASIIEHSARKMDVVAEIRSLGDTLTRWRTEILAHHQTGASNGPTEGLNLLVKEVKRCGRGFENFEHYRLRVLLRAGKPAWPNRPTPPILRTGRPHAHA